MSIRRRVATAFLAVPVTVLTACGTAASPAETPRTSAQTPSSNVGQGSTALAGSPSGPPPSAGASAAAPAATTSGPASVGTTTKARTFDTLRAAAAAAGLHTGTMVNWGILHKAGPARRAAQIGDTLSSVDLSWGESRPTSTTFDFERTDWVRDYARDHHFLLHQSGALAARNLYNRPWLNAGNHTAAQLDALLAAHITTTVKRYRKDVALWRVTHESLGGDRFLSKADNVWMGMGSTGGVPNYIPRAFQLAAAARGNSPVKLYHDESLNAAIGESQTEATYRLMKSLKQRKVPVDGVGFQMHLQVDGGRVRNLVGDKFDYAGFTANLKRYEKLGLEVYLTEFDVRVGDGSAASRRAQAAVYREVARRCAASSACKMLLFWGVDDAHGWENQFRPTMFDADGGAKPAYAAVRDAVTSAAD